MNAERVIMLGEIGNGWYINKTTSGNRKKNCH
jgi:hypothetical protein